MTALIGSYICITDMEREIYNMFVFIYVSFYIYFNGTATHYVYTVA